MTDTTIRSGAYNTSRPILTAIIAGTIVALGLMILFSLLGLAIGIASLEAAGQGLGLGSAIYIVITQIISLAAGAFAAARFMASSDRPLTALTGVAVWALTTLTVAFGGINAGTSIISSSTALVAQLAKTTAGAVQAIAPEDFSLPDMSQIAGSVSMADLPPDLRQALQDANVTPSQLRAEASEAFQNVISQQEMKRARTLLSATLYDIMAKPESFSAEIDRMLDQLFKGENAIFNDQDLTQAQSSLQLQLGINDNQAQHIADAVLKTFNEAIATLRQSAAELQQRLVTTANNVQSTVSFAVFWLFIASALGLLASGVAGAYGRRK